MLAAADVGLVPADAAAAIAEAARGLDVDIDEVGREAVSTGNPVSPLVARLGAAVPESARPWVHVGATSQDILDTALVLAHRAAAALVADRADAAADPAAELAVAHRDTVMVARSLGQHALPTTFGLRAAGWLVALRSTASLLRRRRRTGSRCSWAVRSGRSRGTASGGSRSGAGPGDPARAAGRRPAAVAGTPTGRRGWSTPRRSEPSQPRSARSRSTSGCSPRPRSARSRSEPRAVVARPRCRTSTTRSRRSSRPRGCCGCPAWSRRSTRRRSMPTSGPTAPGTPSGCRCASWSRWSGARRRAGPSCSPGSRSDRDRMRQNLGLTGGAVMAESVAARLSAGLGRAAAHDAVAAVARRTARTGPRSVTPCSPIRRCPDSSTRPPSTRRWIPATRLGVALAAVDEAVRRYGRRTAAAA